MSSDSDEQGFDHPELAALYALRALPAGEMEHAKAHIAQCEQCSSELEALRPVVESLAAWPVNVLRPSEPLWDKLAQRLGAQGAAPAPAPAAERWVEPEWKEAAPGIEVKLLATDAQTDQVSMLVRLAPGVAYPPHSHAGVEELHLLHGELWIEDRKLYPGDYNRAEPGTADKLVWSETGCTCVLITSARDVLGS